MKLKSLLMFALLLQGTAMANATIVQKLFLKNGSELEGYISVQRPGEDFTFTTERAVIYLLKSDLTANIIDNEVNVKQLSQEWIKWAEENEAFEGLGDNRTLKLSVITTKNGTTSNVRILENGAKIKYLEMNKNSYSLNWDTISVLRVDKRPKTALTGINRIYKLENGHEYEGQYVEEVPGKTLSLYRDNGVVEVFETSKVVKYTMRKINPNQGLFEQSELLDVLHLKNKGGNPLQGIIIEQNFGKNPKDDYLLIQKEDGSIQSIKIEDIEEYRKEVNAKYKPMYDILLKENELVINRQMVNYINAEEQASLIVVPKDTCFVQIDKKESNLPIVIETRFPESMNNPTLDIVKVKTFKDKKKKKILFSGFSFEDIVKNNIQPKKVETSVNKTTRFEYDIKESGLYVIYDPKTKKVIPFEINK